MLANAWDAGSARLLAHAGFEAIATTSAGFAFSLGEQDRFPGRDSVLANAAGIVRAKSLPVSADLKNAFGTTQKAVAETIALAGATGLVGASIEDVSYDPTEPLLPLARARDLVLAAVDAARARSRFRSSSPRAPRITWWDGPISPTSSPDCRRTRTPAPTFSMRRASRSRQISAPWSGLSIAR